MLRVSIIQRPVGQGGLCEGALDAGGPPLRWVYDCGSNQTAELQREVARIGGDLDLLFLSHLDADHINGIDLLLARCTVVEVILPYLTDEERILTLAQAVAEGRLTGQFAEFMGDAVGWFRRRGVERVTFVRGRDDQDGADGPTPDAPERPSLECEGRLKPSWSRTPASFTDSPNGIARIVETGAALGLTTPAGQADWIFLPFVQPPSAARLAAFRTELLKRFPGQTAAQIVEAVWRVAGRRDLRDCYDALWGAHNLVSMSLYAGPVSHTQWRSQVTHYNGWRESLGHPPGWLATGDADLSGRRRRDAFKRFYRLYLNKIAVLIVPHHGARPSWDGDVLTGLTRLKIGCAAAGPNGYGHPHPSVIDDVRGHPGASFWQVDEASASALRLTGGA